ncbi:MAG: 1-acyl-sn-glycerol-3-phosphate acyltransferase [Deltaproteobacteria bacterium]|nr:1-acyl-sn-glycerol-3-phosphate acyltransferase [Deltaproteobacteria bacterium]
MIHPLRAQLADAARTVGVGVTRIVPSFARLALHRLVPQPSTSTPAGHAQVAGWSRSILDALGVRLEVLQRERVAVAGGLVFLWNQESHLDHLVLAAAIPRPFFSLYNTEVARFPLYGHFMRTTGHAHVDRNDEPQWRAAIAAAATRVSHGECVLVSPEGTRSADGKLLPMKRGAFLLAVQSGRPIVCATVIGGHERLPRGGMVVRPGPLRVVFSDPIDTAGHSVETGALQARVAGIFETTKRAHRAVR